MAGLGHDCHLIWRIRVPVKASGKYWEDWE
jgi:hypothetical protein